jgi:hypothetical protein
MGVKNVKKVKKKTKLTSQIKAKLQKKFRFKKLEIGKDPLVPR